MEAADEIAFQYLPFIRVYKSGRFVRPLPTAAIAVPASVDPATGVASRDVVIDPAAAVSARLYLPAPNHDDEKLPVVVYYRGGGFCFDSAFSRYVHNNLVSIVAASRVLAVSVEYRNAPEHPLPTAHDDAWAAFQWVASHAPGGAGADEWLRAHADFDRLCLAGDSAGGNLAHHMAMRADALARAGVRVSGVALLFPYFWGAEKMGSEREKGRWLDPDVVDGQWPYLCPGTSGHDDPLINPLAAAAPSLAALTCRRALVVVGEKDVLRDRAKAYCEALRVSGWDGDAECVEIAGEDHCFHFYKTESDKTVRMVQKLAHFFNQA